MNKTTVRVKGYNKYDIDYSRMEGDEKERQGTLDMVEYLGFRRSRLILALCFSRTYTDEQIVNWIGFAGVRGYPAVAAVSRWRKFVNAMTE